MNVALAMRTLTRVAPNEDATPVTGYATMMSYTQGRNDDYNIAFVRRV